MIHRKLNQVEQVSTANLSENKSAKSPSSMRDNGIRGLGRTPGNKSDNIRSHNTLSAHSRSNISDDRTTRRSISDIR